VFRRATLTVLLTLPWFATPASADWLLSPYIGVRFSAQTPFAVGTQAEEHDKFTFGSAFGLLTDRVLGLEADVGFIPGFFEGAFVTDSRVITLMGNVIVATPLEIAQYGLRPYLIAGAGLLHAQSGGPQLDLFNTNLFGMNVGGGALGPLSRKTSLRFEVRYFRSLTHDDAVTSPLADNDISFWRATIGLSYRF